MHSDPTSARPKRDRLDKLLVERGLVTSRERAQALVLAGRVLVDEQKVTKPGAGVAPDAALRLLGDDMPFVSRGGLKLRGALDTWQIDVHGRACCDVGASTGGFTDCLLQAGATSVLAVDTGYGQLAHKLRIDARVTLMERTNARLLTPGALLAAAEGASISLIVMDVSFISVTLVLPAVIRALAGPGAHWHGEAVVLVKPQFEAGREWVGKGGIVRDERAQLASVDRVGAAVREGAGEVLATRESPITGTEGNREWLLHARW